MNKINPRKLLGSKWTAVTPRDKEKHFVVSEMDFDDEERVLKCGIEAIMSKRSITIDWQDLKDDKNWVHGWK